MKKNVILFLCCLSLCVGKMYAQDIHFSQFYENAILRNPALTGIFSGDYKVSANYRSQWSSISVPFQTVMASAETRVLVNKEVGDYLSFGLTTTYDHAGTISFNTFQVYPAINYNKAIEDHHNSYLSVGFTAGYVHRSFDPSKATFSSQYVGGSYNAGNGSGENITNVTTQNYDLGAGISYNSSAGANNNINYYVGAAAYHITKPKQTFNKQDELIRQNTKLTANLGVKCNLTDQYGFVAHLNYTSQSPYSELLAGGLLSWRTPESYTTSFTLYAGAFVRYKDAVIPTLKMDYKSYSFTMSYDMNTSQLRPASNGMGGFEMTVSARGNYKRSLQRGYQTSCPRFEQMLPNEVVW